jgi:nucleotidyltransferase substrate binding protein (TIGR01987 family)
MKSNVPVSSHGMAQLKNKYKNFIKTYRVLEKSIALLRRTDYSDIELYDAVVTASVKRFEMAYEAGWKFLKTYLEVVHEVQAQSPRAIFAACQAHRVFSGEDSSALVLLVDDRNMTTHVYDQDSAQEVCDLITQHYQSLGKIVTISLPEESGGI